MRRIEDDEASLLNVAPKLTKLPVAGCLILQVRRLKSEHKAECKAHLGGVVPRMNMHWMISERSHISVRCLVGILRHGPYTCMQHSTPVFHGPSNMAAYLAPVRAHHRKRTPNDVSQSSRLHLSSCVGMDYRDAAEALIF